MGYMFTNDYSEGCHPRILNALVEANLEQRPGYGTDSYSDLARQSIKRFFELTDHRVYFFVGGTQVNLTAMAAFLRPYQGVIAATTGHVAVHEAGAIEATGHKVLCLPGQDGKLAADQVEAYLENFFADQTHEHMVEPGMIYISQPTELGTLYTQAELAGLRQVADRYKIPLYLDGARLAMALAESDYTGLEPADYGKYCDLFYIGGTKCGALLGEALVIKASLPQQGFRSIIKQRVGLLAKGWVAAIPFIELFKDQLYIDLGAYANQLADDLRQGIKALGLDFYVDNRTNQLFPILPKSITPIMAEEFGCELIEELDSGWVVRFVTSWASREEGVQALLERLAKLVQA